ncbi:acyl-protein synthetase [Anaerovibrio lipolyticus]|uniref:LuxE/PaaK family acyltransferase n=1 Tax=Anaerovibrio lipolyticus TaxID=82374 RepID=UPI000A6C1AB6|nr:acyl-protein synthetase [Anaerovibrio lipolyticus]
MLEKHLEYLSQDPYGMAREAKQEYLRKCLQDLIIHHRDNCSEYARVLEALAYDDSSAKELEDLPFLPVQLFKEFELMSVPKSAVVKTMMSSGTSGQKRSKVFLDRPTAMAQSRCLSNIMASFIGKKRLPMIILDTELAKKDPRMFSARGAGIIGFSLFGRDVFFALDDNMEIRWKDLQEYIERHSGERIVLFGYTYIIWQYIVKAMQNKKKNMGLTDGTLFHIGGWKKLQAESVSAQTYNQALKDVCGDIDIHNYYGMAEQLGSVFVECENGHMHCSVFSDVIIRDPKDFRACGIGEEGLVELISVLPSSYPGHVLLTEDWGRIMGEDDCPCGRKGKYFELQGRIKKAEIRGCSDTYGQ